MKNFKLLSRTLNYNLDDMGTVWCFIRTVSSNTYQSWLWIKQENIKFKTNPDLNTSENKWTVNKSCLCAENTHLPELYWFYQEESNIQEEFLQSLLVVIKSLQSKWNRVEDF